jgi:hypothetical protein
MKKLLWLSLTLVAFTALASASPVNCGNLFNGNKNTNIFSAGQFVLGGACSIDAGAGNYITALTLTGTDDYTGYSSGNPTVNFTVLLTEVGGSFFNATESYCPVITTGTNSTPCNTTPNPNTQLNANTAMQTYSFSVSNLSTASVSVSQCLGD